MDDAGVDGPWQGKREINMHAGVLHRIPYSLAGADALRPVCVFPIPYQIAPLFPHQDRDHASHIQISLGNAQAPVALAQPATTGSATYCPENKKTSVRGRRVS